jgi:PE family
MWHVVAISELLASAATDLERIGSSLSGANVAAAAPTTAVAAAAGDEVSAAIASVFSGYAQKFHTLSAQTAVFHSQFVQAVTAAGARMRLRRRPTLAQCRRCWG